MTKYEAVLERIECCMEIAQRFESDKEMRDFYRNVIIGLKRSLEMMSVEQASRIVGSAA